MLWKRSIYEGWREISIRVHIIFFILNNHLIRRKPFIIKNVLRKWIAADRFFTLHIKWSNNVDHSHNYSHFYHCLKQVLDRKIEHQYIELSTVKPFRSLNRQLSVYSFSSGRRTVIFPLHLCYWLCKKTTTDL